MSANAPQSMQGNMNKPRSIFRSIALTALLAVVTTFSFGQNEILNLKGSLKDEASGKKLDGVQIQIFKNGTQFDVVDAGASAKFDFELPLGFSYDIKFTRQGFGTKILRFDTRNIPPEDRVNGFGLDLTMELFTIEEGFNTDILKEPIGKAGFDSQENNIAFDFGYTETMQAKIEAERKRLADLKKDADKFKKEYDKLMAEGDGKMGEKKYQDAMAKFDGALKLFPKDVPAKQKYDEAKAKFDAENAAASADAQYNKLLADGDANLKAKKWEDARKNFTDASKLKPSEKLPKERLYDIDLLVKYDKLVKDADTRFGSKDYAVSIEKYKESITALANSTYESKATFEKYSKDQITKAQAALDELLAGENKKKELQKKYDDLIAAANKDFDAKTYEGALKSYKEASALISTEAYPKQRISEIEKILADLAAQKSKDAAAEAERLRLEKQYADLITAADKSFGLQKYDDALVSYRSASDLKKTEQYPKDKIAEIEKIKADLLAQKSKAEQEAALAAERERIEKKYKEAIGFADKNFADKNYDAAIVKYNEAKSIKPDEAYPKDQLAEIERLKKAAADAQANANAVAAAENERLKIDREYNALILEADALFKEAKQKDEAKLLSAKEVYDKASKLKDQEKYPKAQITNIDVLIERLKKEQNDLADDEAKRKEQERLDLENRIKSEREEKERLAEEARLRRIEEEEQKRKEQEAALAAEAEARNKRGAANTDRSREEEVDAYYREAKAIEDRAKYETLKSKKDEFETFGKDLTEKNANLYASRSAEIEGQKETMDKMNHEGGGWQNQSIAEQNEKKDRNENNNKEYSDRGVNRTQLAEERNGVKKESLDSLPSKDAVRQRSIDNMNQKKAVYTDTEDVLRSRGETLTSLKAGRMTEKKEGAENVQYDGENLRKEHVEQANEKKDMADAYIQDVQRTASVRTTSNYQKTEDKKVEAEEMGEGKQAAIEDRIMETELKKQSVESLNADKETEAAEARYQRRSEMFALNPGKPKTDNEYQPRAGSENLQEGVTETSFDYGNKKIIERTVKSGNKVDTYRKVVSKTGIYYFKNNKSITEQMWILETLQSGN